VIGAVADAGPVIHLFEIGCLPLLQIFDLLHLPDAVWAETVGRGRVPDTALGALAALRRQPPPDTTLLERFIHSRNLRHLHAGETQALHVAHELRVPILLTDDLAVRDAAHALGLVPVGSLGVIARACRQGAVSLPDAEQRMMDLYNVSTLFVTRAIVDAAVAELRRRLGP